jgi:cellulose synthase/poly-beta-1,6-N-acetylglucosamine synthase-like glycosyltransferase
MGLKYIISKINRYHSSQLLAIKTNFKANLLEQIKLYNINLSGSRSISKKSGISCRRISLELTGPILNPSYDERAPETDRGECTYIYEDLGLVEKTQSPSKAEFLKRSIENQFININHTSRYYSIGIIYAYNQSDNFGLIKTAGSYPIKYCDNNGDFLAPLIRISKDFNLSKAIYALRVLDQSLCAGSYNFTIYTLGFISGLNLLFYSALNMFTLIISSISFMQCCLKSILIYKSFNPSYILAPLINILPIYSILIPLHMEPNQIQFLISSISRLNYPKNRLDVKLVIEEDDLITQKSISLAAIPSHFHVIKVPASLPRTKPKALNYAIQHISGNYVVIFDAEDRPEPNQIIKALRAFSKLKEDYICLQAKLNFYNTHENILTRMQSIEYAIWFNYILKGLFHMEQFVPLGGTSCHFKVCELKKIGLWDPFNVTEDLDLGIRIYFKGYKTAVLDSLTLEEAVINLHAWLKQRARWLKGFMQSYIVFCHNRNRGALTPKQKLTIDIFVGASILNFLIPIYFIIPLAYDSTLINYIVYGNSIFSLIYLIGCGGLAIVQGNKQSARNFLGIKDIGILCLFPIYFVLHTLASYLAIFQLIREPSKWNKTNHGITKFI